MNAAGMRTGQIQRLEDGTGDLALDGGATHADVRAHHRAQRNEIQEVQLPAVPTPAWEHATVDGHLDLAGALRKRPDVDLASPGFIRAVRDTLAVRRNLGSSL